MSVLDVLSLFGGLALFLYGMTIMGSGLEKISGGRLERILEKLTSKVIYGVLVGTAVTGIIQSSSATTVMVVGFVNAGIMSLNQAVGVIMGANIGTTVTSQILRMGDISSDLLVLQLLKPTSLASVVAVIGLILFVSSKKGFKHDFGQILLGFGILFYGMSRMEGAVIPLKDSPAFINLFTAFSNPIIGILIGAAVTAIIQSSSASVGILQALSSTGVIPFSAAAPIILGQNIGTTVTALLSSVGASRNGKRSALIHLYFNVIGTIVFIVALYAVKQFIPFWDDTVDRGAIANFHTIFNLCTVVLLFPFTNLLVKLAQKTLPNKPTDDEEPELEALDPRFLTSPSVALERAHETVVQIANLAKKNMSRATKLLLSQDEQKLARLMDTEEVIDRAETRLGNYLMSLTDRDLTMQESRIQTELMRSVSDFERIADYIVNVAEISPQMMKTKLSPGGLSDLTAMLDAIGEILNLTIQAYTERNVQMAYLVEPFEQVIDGMTSLLRSRHIGRLKRGDCSAEQGTGYVEMLINLERIGDHCSNIAVGVISTYGKNIENFDSHEYARKMHNENLFEFNKNYAELENKYLVPLRGEI